MIDLYNIEGTKNICQYDLDCPSYNTDTTWPTFKEDYEKFKEKILDGVKEKRGLVFLRLADGEFYFLEGQSVGNIPRRHISKPISSINMSEFREGCYKADFIMTQLYGEWIQKYNSIFPDRKLDFPMEFAYSIVANKWIFKTFGNKIGLIGSAEKLNVIQKLMQSETYREYLGTESFADYIPVKERFTCDDVNSLELEIGERIKKSSAELFLFGIGMAKMAVAHRFKKYKDAVFIDVGCGISAMAGMTSLERPYFGGWTNFRLNDYDYSGIDQMDYRDTAGLNELKL
jgi:hypothetical protein